MKYKLIVTSAAQLEIRDALNHYHDINPALALELLETVEASYELLEDHPQYYSYFYNSEILRSCRLQKFPYAFVFQIKVDEVFVIALHHHKSDPERILNRI